MEEDVREYYPLHRDLSKIEMRLQHTAAVELALKWFKKNKPFNSDRDKELLVSFSTGFTSTGDDSVNADKAAEIGRNIQTK